MTDAKSVSVMDADKIDRSLTRIAHEIVERHRDVGRLVLVGIRTRGVPLARRLQGKVRAIEGKELPLGILDINLYRDDITSVGPSAILKETIIHFPIDERRVILVDDVLFTGRRASSWRSWSTGGTASCRSAPTTSARTCPRISKRWCRCCSRRTTAATRCCW